MSHITHTPQIHRRDRTDRRQATGFTRFIRKYNKNVFTARLGERKQFVSGHGYKIESSHTFLNRLHCFQDETLHRILTSFGYYNVTMKRDGSFTFQTDSH